MCRLRSLAVQWELDISFVSDTLKQCACCRMLYARTDFYKNHTAKDGLNWYCKQCSHLKSVAQQKVSLRKDPRPSMLRKARHRAKVKKIECSISLSDIFLPSVCPVLGIPLVVAGSDRSNAPTLDRIDSKLGYIPNNICVISYRANLLKNNGTELEHLQIARYIQNHTFTH